MLERFITKNRSEDRSGGIHCSDFGKSSADIFFRLTGVEETNPPHWYDKLKWGAGKGVELEAVQVLKDSGIVREDYNQDIHGVVEKEINGIKVSGHIDAIAIEGYPIEIKSINNANKWDIQKYADNNPRENYVGQLAMYMYILNQDKGGLLVCSIDGLNRFWFDCVKISEGVYQCGNTVVDLNKEFIRWSKIVEAAKASKTIPDEFLWEKRYKIPVEEIDWEKVSAGDISKMRNGHKVLGDWEVLYSSYKDLIVKLQGSELGYTIDELKIIKDKTDGYTSWSKK